MTSAASFVCVMQVQWRDVLNPRFSVRSRRIWHFFFLANLAFYVFTVIVTVVDWSGVGNVSDVRWSTVVVELVLVVLTLRYMFSAGRVYHKCSSSGATAKVMKEVRRALIIFLAVMLLSALLMIARTTFVLLGNKGNYRWPWIIFVQLTPGLATCVGYLYLMWGKDEEVAGHTDVNLFLKLLEEEEERAQR